MPKVVVTDSVDKVIVEVCEENEKRNEVIFFEIGTTNNLVRFFIQCLPSFNSAKIVTRIKILVALEAFKGYPEVKE